MTPKASATSRFFRNKFLFCFLLFRCSNVISTNFDINSVLEINLGKNSVGNTYFGYSLLLQNGRHAQLIVGAPKDINGEGGSVYSCDIEYGVCRKYWLITESYNNGSFLGASVDGDDATGRAFIACAPRKIKQRTEYAPGFCYYVSNSSNWIKSDAVLAPAKDESTIEKGENGYYYYSYAFAETGMDICYNKDKKMVLLGAPGANDWRGAVFEQSVERLSYRKVTPDVSAGTADAFSYLGYKVTTGYFERMLKRISIIVGAPRGMQMRGMVKIFVGAAISHILPGEELGSYFGSALLAVDVNNDKIDELFVGAPLGAGTSFDEGYVYVYGKNMKLMVKLTGPKNRGARFGSSIIPLGDIDLDSYNDIAISAPYEDDGVGAVYIYRGSKNGIGVSPSQKLSPRTLKGVSSGIKSFGQGLSRGNDIDGNGHNDLAIGAYKSNTAFTVKTLTVIDYRLALESNVTAIGSKINYIPTTINYCIYYTQRSKVHDVTSITFNVSLKLDYRTQGEKMYAETWTIYLAQTFCKQVDIVIMQSMVDIQPFQVSMKVLPPTNVYAEGDSKMELSIPYSHKCGSDNVCQTFIVLTTTTMKPYIIVGLDNQFEVYLVANNTGEPGYQCQLYLGVPEELDYETKENCNLDNGTYVCQFVSILSETAELRLKFYMASKIIETDKLELKFEVKCLGESPVKSVSTITKEVRMENSPYIEGKAYPEKIYLKNEKDSDYVDLSFTFIIGNYGPSPVKTQITILIPAIKHGGNDIFEFIEAHGKLSDQDFQCNALEDRQESTKVNPVVLVDRADVNRTTTISCFDENSNCLEVFCPGGYLYTSSEVARYTVKIRANLKMLGVHFTDVFVEKDILAYAVSTILYNSTARLEKSSLSLIYSSASSIPLWIIILASVLGLLLLLALTFLLYKCHFFDRRYRDKLNSEKLVNEHADSDPENEMRVESDTEDL